MSKTFIYIGIIVLHESNCLVAAAQRLQGTRTRMQQSPGFPAPRGPIWAAQNLATARQRMAKNYGQRTRICMHGAIKILSDLEYPDFWPHGANPRIDVIN